MNFRSLSVKLNLKNQSNNQIIYVWDVKKKYKELYQKNVL
jgi:hypothetical protein